MADLFLVLFFLSLLGLVVGMINPSVFTRITKKELTRKRIGLTSFGAMFVFLVLVGITHNTNTQAPTPAQSASTPVATQVFDIPNLIGKNLEEIRAIFGTPSYDGEPTATRVQFSDDRTWDKTWSKEGYSLTATYNIDNGKVTELFLGSDSDASLVVFRNKENILKVGNLSENDNKYSLEFVKLKAILGNPNKPPEGYTGVIVRAR